MKWINKYVNGKEGKTLSYSQTPANKYRRHDGFRKLAMYMEILGENLMRD